MAKKKVKLAGPLVLIVFSIVAWIMEIFLQDELVPIGPYTMPQITLVIFFAGIIWLLIRLFER